MLQVRLGDSIVGYVTSRALLLDPDLSEAEVRFVRFKADLARGPLLGCVLRDDPQPYDDAFLDQLARAALIPDTDLLDTDDDRYIADLRMVPVEQVAIARRERLDLRLTAYDEVLLTEQLGRPQERSSWCRLPRWRDSRRRADSGRWPVDR